MRIINMIIYSKVSVINRKGTTRLKRTYTYTNTHIVSNSYLSYLKSYITIVNGN